MKAWYKSKMVWVNIVGAVVIAVQTQTGYVVPLELQAIALAGINFILRKVTDEEIVWSE